MVKEHRCISKWTLVSGQGQANPNYTCNVDPEKDGLGFVTYLMVGDLVTYRANRSAWISTKGDWDRASRQSEEVR